MPTRMLIDARHREETRVAVVQNNRIEEFDFESEEHKQLKGNIYLAKVTRVEPSLQAAFVDYGGNRHGFLAFSEIHPDYYQIPKEDRDKLLAEEVEQAKEEAELREEEDDEQAAEAASKEEDAEVEETGDSDADEEHHEEPSVKNIRKRRMDLRRRYKIQDVIHRRQVLLVQVVKEERGNKGAALTTYLSLAGRYCVLMPNTSHGGGISRKISNASDRKRLKSIVDEMKLPETMGCIVRTAGMSRTKTEIKRDFTYLARLWDEIREATLKATAPEKIYTDSDLIKRAIRDIYNRDIEEVFVEGDEGYKAAKDFMKLLMPSHARRVKHYADPTPLFQRYQVEDQLGAMYQPLVQLKSGGYLVINPTEALVSIDINSGRSTREHNIEQTALKTNIEAAREIARQLRLRDMAGLVVIDFIDMDHNSNNRKVEKALKDALKNDRARIQVGRISSFGLLEMSRQRLRTGVLEASTQECPHCGGTGLMRTVSSAGLSALRMLEEEAAKGKGSELTLACSRDAAVYVLNTKRRELGEIEEMYGVTISVVPDRELEGAAMNIEVGGPPPTKKVEMRPIELDEDDDIEVDVEDEVDESETETETDEEESRSRSRSRRRRGRRGGRNRRRDKEQDDGTEDKAASAKSDESDDAGDSQKSEAGAENGDADSGEKKPRRRRRSRKADSNETEQTASGDKVSDGDESAEAAEATEAAEEKPKRQRSRRTKKDEQPEAEAKDGTSDKAEEPEAAAKDDAKSDDAKADDAEAKPKRRGRPPKAANGSKAPAKSDDGKAEAADEGAAPKSEDNATADSDAKPRRGWWQRTFGE
ncbi:MAG: Rne/Rng family ribonuclease [Parasphingopyxis sp.]|uniref:ribonuclease E/G n=1 Tax=Parasphingopyxis sp. TaxID=1920299 RepID=UPI0032EDB82A